MQPEVVEAWPRMFPSEDPYNSKFLKISSENPTADKLNPPSPMQDSDLLLDNRAVINKFMAEAKKQI